MHPCRHKAFTLTLTITCNAHDISHRTSVGVELDAASLEDGVELPQTLNGYWRTVLSSILEEAGDVWPVREEDLAVLEHLEDIKLHIEPLPSSTTGGVHSLSDSELVTLTFVFGDNDYLEPGCEVVEISFKRVMSELISTEGYTLYWKKGKDPTVGSKHSFFCLFAACDDFQDSSIESEEHYEEYLRRQFTEATVAVLTDQVVPDSFDILLSQEDRKGALVDEESTAMLEEEDGEERMLHLQHWKAGDDREDRKQGHLEGKGRYLDDFDDADEDSDDESFPPWSGKGDSKGKGGRGDIRGLSTSLLRGKGRVESSKGGKGGEKGKGRGARKGKGGKGKGGKGKGGGKGRGRN